MKKVLLIVTIASPFIIACKKQSSADVNQDKIYARYEQFYNANDDKTHVIARLNFGSATGTLLELSDSAGAYVTFNGDTLPYEFLYFGHHKEFAGKIPPGTFTYKDIDGNVFINQVPTNTDTIAFPSSFNTIQKSVAETLIWIGTPLGADESVGIFVGSWSFGDDALFYTDDDGATNIVMGVNAKSELTTGTAIVYMDRTNKVPAAQATSVGGDVIYKYRAKNTTVNVTN